MKIERLLLAETDPRTAKVLFWVACLVIFSKIVWYDLGSYYPLSEDRRAFSTICHAAWIIAQFAIFLTVLPKLFRQISAPVIFWTLAAMPYFILGLVYGRFGVFFIGDVARYALPIGWMLLFSLLLPRLSGSDILKALIGSLLLCVVVRNGLHLIFTNGRMRYGRHYEIMLVGLLLLLPAVVSRKHLISIAIVAVAVPLSMMLGNTRVIIGGIVGVALLTAAFAFFDARFARYQAEATAASASILIILSGIALTGHLPGLDSRMDIAKGPAHRTLVQLASISSDLPTVSEKELARREWEKALRSAGPRTIYDRIAEARYFLVAMTATPLNFWLGAGSGDSVTINLSAGNDRVVRGAHNTAVTLLHRHGAILGPLLILFAALYGLPANFRQYLNAPSAAWRIILASVISYRMMVILLSQFHQGMFDDPIVFLSIALSTAVPMEFTQQT